MDKIGDVGYKFQNCLAAARESAYAIGTAAPYRSACPCGRPNEQLTKNALLVLSTSRKTRSRGGRKTRRHEATSGAKRASHRVARLKEWKSGCVTVRSAQWWPATLIASINSSTSSRRHVPDLQTTLAKPQVPLFQTTSHLRRASKARLSTCGRRLHKAMSCFSTSQTRDSQQESGLGFHGQGLSQ